MKTCVYLRVSSTDQTTDSQKAEIIDWLERNGSSAAQVKWYVDTETGKTLARPAMTRLRRDVEAEKVQTVIVQRLDRLSRRMIDGLNLVAHWANRGVRIVAVRQHIDVTGPLGLMLAAVILGFAENESEIRRERQAAGIAVAKEKGRLDPSKKVYRGRKPGTFKADPQLARELAAAGWSRSEIARALGIHRESVARYLRHERNDGSADRTQSNRPSDGPEDARP